MDDSDDFFTKEEMALYLEATRKRIENIERKAVARLAMNDEEKTIFKMWHTIQKNPELRELIVTLIAACNDSETKPQ